MINRVKKVIVLLLVAAVVSLGLTGCKHKNEQPTEGTSSEHPAKKAPAEEKKAEEQPAGEHPSAEHPQ